MGWGGVGAGGMREARAGVRAPLPPEGFFRAAFGDGAGVRGFYEGEAGGRVGRVTPWRAGRREVELCLRVELPAWLLKVVGTDQLVIREEQRVVREVNGRITVTSKPTLEVYGGHLFQSPAEFVIEPWGADSCEVTVVLCCSSTLWGVSDAVEAAMCEQGIRPLREFLLYCERQCRRLAGEPEALPRTPGWESDTDSSCVTTPVKASEGSRTRHFGRALTLASEASGPGGERAGVPGGGSPSSDEEEGSADFFDAVDPASLLDLSDRMQGVEAALSGVEQELRDIRRLVRAQTLVAVAGWAGVVGAVGYMALGRNQRR